MRRCGLPIELEFPALSHHEVEVDILVNRCTYSSIVAPELLPRHLECQEQRKKVAIIRIENLHLKASVIEKSKKKIGYIFQTIFAVPM